MLGSHVNAQSCSSRTQSVGQRGLMNCWIIVLCCISPTGLGFVVLLGVCLHSWKPAVASMIPPFIMSYCLTCLVALVSASQISYQGLALLSEAHHPFSSVASLSRDQGLALLKLEVQTKRGENPAPGFS